MQALKDALAVVRHAGLEKKLARNLKPAQRGLAARAEVALRLLPGAKADKKTQSLVATCLEATFWQGGSWPLVDWLAQLADTPNGAPFAFAQLWQVQPGEARRSRCVPCRTRRQVCASSTSRAARSRSRTTRACRCGIRWQATPDERAAWQRVCAELRLRQPVRQAFREIYEADADEATLTSSNEFAGHHLRLQPLIGLARREGWSLAEYALTRRFGSCRAVFGVGAGLYPGVVGNAPSDDLTFFRWGDRRWRRLPLGEVDPLVHSEACRAVDLLVSVSGFALEDATEHLPLTVGDLGVRLVGSAPAPDAPARREHPRVTRMRRVQGLGQRPLGEMAAMRCQALELALAPHIDAGRVVVEARHVRVGEATVHLSTGRVVENGAAVELGPPAAKARLAAVPWLPYDEVLLQRIADNVSALLARS